LDGAARERGQINDGRLPRAGDRAGGTGFAWRAAGTGVQRLTGRGAQPATVPIASPLAGTVNRHIRSWLVPVGAITILGVGAGILVDERPAGLALPASAAVLVLASACWAVGLSERVRDPRMVVSALIGLGLCGACLDWPHGDELLDLGRGQAQRFGLDLHRRGSELGVDVDGRGAQLRDPEDHDPEGQRHDQAPEAKA